MGPVCLSRVLQAPESTGLAWLAAEGSFLQPRFDVGSIIRIVWPWCESVVLLVRMLLGLTRSPTCAVLYE